MPPAKLFEKKRRVAM